MKEWVNSCVYDEAALKIPEQPSYVMSLFAGS